MHGAIPPLRQDMLIETLDIYYGKHIYADSFTDILF
jgi:hypothetical protein